MLMYVRQCNNCMPIKGSGECINTSQNKLFLQFGIQDISNFCNTVISYFHLSVIFQGLEVFELHQLYFIKIGIFMNSTKYKSV